MRTIEEEAEIIYGKRKPNAEETHKALVEKWLRYQDSFGSPCESEGGDVTCVKL